MIIGAPGARASYVVFGKATGFTDTIALSALDGSNGFRLSGTRSNDAAGTSVSGAGDINGDGFDDLIVGAPYRGGGPSAVYVVFGKAGDFSSNLDLSSLDGANGFKVQGEQFQALGHSVSGAGDINGDGFDDVILGAPRDEEDGAYTGAAYVLFGKADGFTPEIALSAFDGDNGFKLTGINIGDQTGNSVSGAGDVNGDGFSDLIIAARDADPHGTYSGAAYVVFGGDTRFSAKLDLSTLDGTNGFRLNGETAYSRIGATVSDAGDVNGDGFDDLIVGSFGPTPAYVVFGKDGGFNANLNVSHLGINGFKLVDVQDFGSYASSAGDVNGDGFDDLILGASYDNSHVVFGFPTDAAVIFKQHHQIARFIDVDGDVVTVKTDKGAFTIADFQFIDAGVGRQLALLDLHGQSAFEGANLSITAQTPPGRSGDGRVNIGAIDATGVALGRVLIEGDLGRNDTLIPGGMDDLMATIASIKIKGLASGSGDTDDFFGLNAESIGRARSHGVKLALTPEKDNLPLDGMDGNSHLVEFGPQPANRLASLIGRR